MNLKMFFLQLTPSVWWVIPDKVVGVSLYDIGVICSIVVANNIGELLQEDIL